MDKKPLRPNAKRTPGGRGFKNVGFVALIVLVALISYAAYRQPSTLQEIPLTTAISQANAGQYKKIEVGGDQLTITKKGESQATLKAFKEEGASLKDEGLNYTKVPVTIKPSSGTGAVVSSLAINLIPVLLIGGLLYFMLKSAQGQGNQALSFGKSRARQERGRSG
jgi:cell division protease FtsH